MKHRTPKTKEVPSAKLQAPKWGGELVFGIWKFFGVWCLVFGVLENISANAAVDVSKLPPAASVTVDFNRDIKPILENSCLKCHGEERPKSKFRLTHREAALKGGANGIDIIAGDSAKSPLIHYVAGLVEDMQMPPPGKGEPLTPDQIGLLRAWIDQGLDWPSGQGIANSQLTLVPSARWITVAGDEHKFRELHWMKEGWSGGIESSTFQKRIDERTTITAELRALAEQNDFKFNLRAQKEELGFARFGFEEFRKYYDDSGGYYGGFATPSFDLRRDLHLDVGKAFVDFGLTLPNWPAMVFGYEYQFRDGEKSTLQWGPVINPAGVAKNFYPAYKGISEHVHIIRFDLTHEIGGVNVENNFRGEFYDLETRRVNAFSILSGSPPSGNTVTLVNEGDRHFQGANTFRLEKQIKDWWFASGGYFYSRMDADGSFQLQTVNGAGTPVFGDQWRSQSIVLERESHIFNLNSLLGPWEGLTFSGGLQNEWTRQKGFGNVSLDVGDPTDLANYFPAPAMHNANLDTVLMEENCALRYTTIPNTVLFADARFKQQSIGQFESATGSHQFLRDTDATEDLKEFRGGFTVSPWRAVSLTTRYKHSDHESDYDHNLDQVPSTGFKNEGYSAFIRSRDVRSDEIDVKLVLRPAKFWKTSLGYKLLATDYHTETDEYTNAFFGILAPGGSIFAGNYDASIYSINNTLTPMRRLYLSTTASFTRARTATTHQGFSDVVNYRGDILSVIASANYAASDKTDLTASYSFSRADFKQNNPNGLPAGIVYDWHSAQAGVTRRFKRGVTASLQYGYYRYDEPTSGGINNFTAHAIFATLSFKWP